MAFLFAKNKTSRIKDLNDEELVQCFFENKKTELAGELFNRYTQLVFGVCMKYIGNAEEAKDAVMQIFEHLLTLEQKEEITNFKGWLFTVAKNHCLMILRKNKSVKNFKELKFAELESEIMELPSVMHLYDTEENEIQVKRLHQAIETLKPEQKTCVELFYLENKVYKEISEITGYELNAVKSYIQNGKRNLKILLENGKKG